MDENTDTDIRIRTRDLAERQRQIMDGALGSPWEPPKRQWYPDNELYAQQHLDQAHPRRTDWYRVAALTIVILAACAATAALIVALALVLTAF